MGIHIPIMWMRKLRLNKVKRLAIISQLVSRWQDQDLNLVVQLHSTTVVILSGIITALNAALNLIAICEFGRQASSIPESGFKGSLY